MAGKAAGLLIVCFIASNEITDIQFRLIGREFYSGHVRLAADECTIAQFQRIGTDQGGRFTTAYGEKRTSRLSGSMSAFGPIPDVTEGWAERQILTLVV
jgi:hypothetical protein